MSVPGNYNLLYPDVIPLTDQLNQARILAPEQTRPQINLARNDLRGGEDVTQVPLADANYMHQYADSLGYQKPGYVDPMKFLKYETLTGV